MMVQGAGAWGWRRAAELALCTLLQLARAPAVCAEGDAEGRSCQPDLFNPCPGEQWCSVATSRCKCLDGLSVSGDSCVRTEPASESHTGLAVTITLFTIVIVVAALAAIVHRYNLIEYARRQWDVRRNRDVMYEDVMIGQDDDPPLSL